MIEFKFHPDHAQAVADRSKRYTLRIKPETHPQPGDDLRLVDSDGEILAIETCRLHGIITAGWIPLWHFDAHRDYDSLDHLKREMEEYYPDKQIDRDTIITVIGW